MEKPIGKENNTIHKIKEPMNNELLTILPLT
jgi:hypothetical protein